MVASVRVRPSILQDCLRRIAKCMYVRIRGLQCPRRLILELLLFNVLNPQVSTGPDPRSVARALYKTNAGTPDRFTVTCPTCLWVLSLVFRRDLIRGISFFPKQRLR